MPTNVGDKVSAMMNLLQDMKYSLFHSGRVPTEIRSGMVRFSNQMLSFIMNATLKYDHWSMGPLSILPKVFNIHSFMTIRIDWLGNLFGWLGETQDFHMPTYSSEKQGKRNVVLTQPLCFVWERKEKKSDLLSISSYIQYTRGPWTATLALIEVMAKRQI